MGKGSEWTFLQGYVPKNKMANKYMERCSASLVIRGMQIKTTKRYYFIPTWMTKINTQMITSIGKDVEKLATYTADTNVK